MTVTQMVTTRLAALVAACMLVAGCGVGSGIRRNVTNNVWADNDDARCQGLGAKPGTDTYVNCRMMAQRERNDSWSRR
jgi:hypothetical protein